ncbi:MAG: alpha/beta hydrolase-fold protein [Pseudomonadales bacterium]
MKSLLFIITLLISTCLHSSTKFEVPRSSIVEVKELAKDRIYPLFIKLPKSYEKERDREYPVIYLTDAWYSFQIVSGATRFPMNSGVMEEAIIVGISYSKGSRGSSSRIRDYTPTKAADWKSATGNAAGHAEFIRSTVFPYIESNYRASKEERTFVGNSLGGLFGTHILLTEPDMFSSYIIGSPSVWFDDNVILSQAATPADKSVKVYLSVGSLETPDYGGKQDMVAGAKALAEKLSKNSVLNIELKFSIISDAYHDTAFPTTAIQGLDWIYRK